MNLHCKLKTYLHCNKEVCCVRKHIHVWFLRCTLGLSLASESTNSKKDLTAGNITVTISCVSFPLQLGVTNTHVTVLNLLCL